MKCVIFTDLDGTLLDMNDFSFTPAEHVIRQLRECDIPLVIVTSKTLAEIESLANEVEIDGPAIIESGGAVAMRVQNDRWTVIPLGMPASEIRELVPMIEHLSGARLLLYSQMSPLEAELLSGLSGEALRRSMMREFDEPFVLGEGKIGAVAQAAEHFGLAVREGGRFHHLTGRFGKGDAVRRILEALDDNRLIIALGDAPMDAEFLELADIPIVMRGSDGLPNRELLARLPEAMIAPASGPRGWARALEELLPLRDLANDARRPN